jgi:choline dehydrogenase
MAMEASEFDYVIVGAGAAGSVLASRLSEAPQTTVCVLEAGPSDRALYITIPAGFTKVVVDPRYTWDFLTEPTKMTGGRAIHLIQGRVLGGGTSVNGMAYNRGQSRDFDAWAEAGNPGWSYRDLLPIFMALEDRQDGDPAYRGKGGPLKVTDVAWDDVVLRAFERACVAAGVPRNPDYNGPRQQGVAVTQANIAGGRRVSASSAFLRPAARRPNVSVRTGVLATRVLLENGVAVGVVCRADGAETVVRARREVILSAGAINTPRLLQLSGIGRPEWLQAAGIPVAHALPGVGANLRDHYMVSLVAKGKNYRSINERATGVRLWLEVLRWMAGRRSILGLPVALLHYFLESGVVPGDCDIQGIFTPASGSFDKYGKIGTEAGMTCAVWQHHPRSAGYVRLSGPAAETAPLVQPNYLGEEVDRQVLIAACRRTRALLGSAEMASYFDVEQIPGKAVESDDEWLDFARTTGSTVFHPCGTARMGPVGDLGAVVDAALRVHGIERLRVVDASVMPDIPSANTAASTMVIGAKAAELIRSSEMARSRGRAPSG